MPGGKASMIVDNSTGELKGIGGMGFWWDEEVDTTRFVKLFLDGIKQAAGLSKTGIQVRDGAIPDLGTAKSTVDQFRETSPPPTLCRWRPDWQLKANWHPDFSTKTIL